MPHLGRKAMGHAHLVDALVVEGRDSAGEQHQALVLELRQIQRGVAGQRMLARQAGHKGLLHQQLAVQAFGQHHRMHQAHVQLGLLQAQQLLGAVELAHVDAHLGMRALEMGQCLGHPPVQRRADKAQPQMAAHALAHIPRLLHRLPGQRQQLACTRQQVGAGGGEPHALAAALKQRRANFFLQLADGDRQRRLGDGQALGRTAEVQLLSQGRKVVQQSQLHGHSCLYRISIDKEFNNI